jgi:hypothetical protein
MRTLGQHVTEVLAETKRIMKASAGEAPKDSKSKKGDDDVDPMDFRDALKAVLQIKELQLRYDLESQARGFYQAEEEEAPGLGPQVGNTMPPTPAKK